MAAVQGRTPYMLVLGHARCTIISRQIPTNDAPSQDSACRERVAHAHRAQVRDHLAPAHALRSEWPGRNPIDPLARGPERGTGGLATAGPEREVHRPSRAPTPLAWRSATPTDLEVESSRVRGGALDRAGSRPDACSCRARRTGRDLPLALRIAADRGAARSSPWRRATPRSREARA